MNEHGGAVDAARLGADEAAGGAEARRPAPKPLLPALQGWRGVAALLVALSHLNAVVANHGLPTPLPDFGFGFFGVDLFFAISGFIMMYVAGDAAGGRASARFLLGRVIRLVPLYWLFTTIEAAIILRANRHMGLSIHVHDVSLLVASYLFVPYPEMLGGEDAYPIYVVGWTLNYEMLFYLAFSAAIALWPGRKLLVVTATFVALAGAGVVFVLPLPLSFWSSPLTLEFCLGMGVAALHRAGVRLSRAAAAGLALIALGGAAWFLTRMGDWGAYQALGWGLPAAALVASATLPRSGGLLLGSRPVAAIGTASYSLYLGHPLVYDTVVSCAERILDPTSPAWPPLLYAMWGAAAGLALLLFRFVERPVTRALQRRLLGHASLPDATPP